MTNLAEIKICTIEYLRGLAELVDDAESDPACATCKWAVDEIERLRGILDEVRQPDRLFAEDAYKRKVAKIGGNNGN